MSSHEPFDTYPLMFEPILKFPIWGGKRLYSLKNIPPQDRPLGEIWEISAVEGNETKVANGELAGTDLTQLIDRYGEHISGTQVYKRYGKRFPLLIKFIDADRDLSVQVHPGDRLAQERHGSPGKDEMWYIINARPESRLLFGFNRKIDRQTYLDAVHHGTLPGLLHEEPVAAGDVYYIPAGRAHAIGGGILLAEIQQSSDITYRIYDWNRGRELHTGPAAAAIHYDHPKTFKTHYKSSPGTVNGIVNSPHFTTEIIDCKETLHFENDGKSFHILINVSGEAVISGNFENLRLPYLHTTLLPASLSRYSISCRHRTKILRVRL